MLLKGPHFTGPGFGLMTAAVRKHPGAGTAEVNAKNS